MLRMQTTLSLSFIMRFITGLQLMQILHSDILLCIKNIVPYEYIRKTLSNNYAKAAN